MRQKQFWVAGLLSIALVSVACVGLFTMKKRMFVAHLQTGLNSEEVGIHSNGVSSDKRESPTTQSVWIDLDSPTAGEKFKFSETIRISGKVLNSQFYGKKLIVTLICGMENHKSMLLQKDQISIGSEGVFKGSIISPKSLPQQCYGGVGIDFSADVIDSPKLGLYLKIPD